MEPSQPSPEPSSSPFWLVKTKNNTHKCQTPLLHILLLYNIHSNTLTSYPHTHNDRAEDHNVDEKKKNNDDVTSVDVTVDSEDEKVII